MLSKSVQNRNHLARALKQHQGAASQNSRLIAVAKRAFSHGPYNPLAYKTMLVAEDMPSTEDYYAIIKSHHSTPPGPIYNMRHIHPVR